MRKNRIIKYRKNSKSGYFSSKEMSNSIFNGSDRKKDRRREPMPSSPPFLPKI